MANISTSTNCNVSFTEEEKEILQKAREICKDIGHEIWSSCNGIDEDEISFFFFRIGDSIENILNGIYESP